MDVYMKMKEKGIVLPPAPPAGGLYSPIKEFAGTLVYTSGVGPNGSDGAPLIRGKVGKDLTLEQGQEAAKLAALNILSILHDKLGDLNRIDMIVKMLGFVASADDFYDQPLVMNAATQLLIDGFGEEKGKPARSAIAVNVLPGNIPVEIELVIELKDK